MKSFLRPLSLPKPDKKQIKDERKKKLDKWARARNNAKSNVGEYTT